MARRAEERLPLPLGAGRSRRREQQGLDRALTPGDPPEEPGEEHARVVHHQAVSRPEPGRQVAHVAFVTGARGSVEDQEARGVARLRGLLGDPLGRQDELEEGEGLSQCGSPAPRPDPVRGG